MPEQREKRISAKQRWIKETQLFQHIASNGQRSDDEETLSKDYDEWQQERAEKKRKRSLV